MIAGSRIGAIALVLIAFFTPGARAADPEAIKTAVEAGVRLLKHVQGEDGRWNHGHRVGASALVALTLLECDVEPNDQGIQKAAATMRQMSLGDTETSDSCLAIIV